MQKQYDSNTLQLSYNLREGFNHGEIEETINDEKHIS